MLNVNSQNIPQIYTN